jgi:uncharacterized protein involved in exopolysaccharide biosynthesis
MSERSIRISAVPPVAEPDTAGPRTPSGASDEVDLAPYLAILWRYRFAIVAVALLAGAAAFVNAFRSTRLYEASAMISVSPSKLADTASAAIATANYRPIVANRAVAQKVVEHFHLDASPYAYTGTSFLEEAVQLEEIRNTALLRLSVRLPDPRLAADVANGLASFAVDYAQSLSSNEVIRVRDTIKLQLDLATARLKQTGDALAAFKRTSQLDLARTDVDAILDERKSLLGLLVEIEGKKASVREAERELAGRKKLDVTAKSIDQDPAMLEASRPRTSATGSPLGVQMKSESVSRTYEELDTSLAFDRVQLAELEKRRQQLVDVRQLNRPQLTKIREFHDMEAEQARLTLEYGLAERAYQEVSARYEGARLQVAARSAELQVVDPAVVPTRPLSRQVASKTLTAATVAFGIAALCALVLGLVRKRADPPHLRNSAPG